MLYWPSLEKFFHALIAHFLYLFLEKYLLKSFAPFKTEIVIGFFFFFSVAPGLSCSMQDLHCYVLDL